MKKVLMAFLGLVLFSLTVKYWEGAHPAAALKRPAPPGIYQPPSGNAGVQVAQLNTGNFPVHDDAFETIMKDIIARAQAGPEGG